MPYFDGWMQRRYVSITDADITAMKNDLGVGGVRLTFDLSDAAQNGTTSNPINGLNTNPGGSLDRAEHAATLGMGVLACVTFSPTWIIAATAGHKIPQDSAGRGYWATIFARLVELLDVANGGPVTAWEIYNEPNHGPFNDTPTMATIRPFMRTCILAARAEVADAFIMPGGCASASSRTGQWTTRWDSGTAVTGTSISPATYLDGLYHANPDATGTDGTGLDAGTTGAWASALAIHGYTGPGFGTPPNPGYNIFENPLYHCFRDMPNVGNTAVFGSGGFNYYDDILRRREPGTSKVFWQTEGGTFGGVPSLTEEAGSVHLFYNLNWWQQNQAAGKAGPYIYFEYQDNHWMNVAGNGTRTYESTGTEDYLGMYRKSSTGVLTAKKQVEAWNAMTFYDPDPEDPDPPPPTVDVVPVRREIGTPRSRRRLVPVARYKATHAYP